jgi:NADH dehydrogenase/NADH:ubiquinone oxidoreductase subunit G
MGALLLAWGPVRAFLGSLSLRTWLIVGAAAAMLWMAHSTRLARDQAHQVQLQAQQDRERVAAERAKAAEAQAAQLVQRVTDQQEAVRDADRKTQELGRRLVAARAAADRLQLAADAAAAGATTAYAAGAAAAASSAADRLADVVQQCGRRLVEVGAAADRAVIRGQLCERAYDALTR